MSRLYGYDPARVAALRIHTITAIEELRAIRCGDPAAEDPLRAVRLACRNLEDSWLPFIDQLCASTALTSWTARLLAAQAASRVLDTLNGWIRFTGYDELTDAELIERLLPALDRLDRVLTTNTGVSDAIETTDGLLAEAAQRIWDARFATELWDAIGSAGYAQLISIVHLAGTQPPDRRMIELDVRAALDASIGSLLVALANREPSAAAMLQRDARTSADVVRVVGEQAPLLDPLLIADLFPALVAELEAFERQSRDHPIVHRAAEQLLGALLAHPDVLLDVLGDPALTTSLATQPWYDQTLIESALEVALVDTTRRSADPVPDALGVLSILLAASPDHELQPGARRGVAASFETLLPVFGPYLPAPSPHDTVRSIDVDFVAPLANVTLGTDRQLISVLGQVADDEIAQATMGRHVGTYQSRLIAEAIALIDERRARGELATGETLGNAIKPGQRITDMLLGGIDVQNALHAFDHEREQAFQRSLVSLGITAVSTVLPGGKIVGAAGDAIGGTLGTLGTGDAERVDGAVALRARLDDATLVAIVRLPLDLPRLRADPDLAAVSPETWRELEGHLERYATSDGPDRADAATDIAGTVARDPNLNDWVRDVTTHADG